MKFSDKTLEMLRIVKAEGFNVWAMLHIFKRRSKLKPDIPDEVVQMICAEYLKKKGAVRADFPYFLEVLKRKSADYFAKKEIEEHEKIKKEPVRLKISIG